MTKRPWYFPKRLLVISFLFISFFLVVLQNHLMKQENFKQTELVELIKLDNSIKLDIRYATNNNLAGRPVYSEARAFLPKTRSNSIDKSE